MRTKSSLFTLIFVLLLNFQLISGEKSSWEALKKWALNGDQYRLNSERFSNVISLRMILTTRKGKFKILSSCTVVKTELFNKWKGLLSHPDLSATAGLLFFVFVFLFFFIFYGA
ncbi:uncharacterized protein LOC115562610 [Drosophila navojoa]|uniref:uncharacterized protein LOC115562610 n=1 Tax=Drosophila navojoa TaxID=7232 RepID=UPI0011BF95C6|nr:uncharacterized protein LOC115562610 [Drosophila navojoa]